MQRQGRRNQGPGRDLGHPGTDRRVQEQLKKTCPDGGIEVVVQQPGDFNPDEDLTVMENILQFENEIDAVYIHGDDMAQGVVQAIRNLGRDDEMLLTGVGVSQAAMEPLQPPGPIGPEGA